MYETRASALALLSSPEVILHSSRVQGTLFSAICQALLWAFVIVNLESFLSCQIWAQCYFLRNTQVSHLDLHASPVQQDIP